MSLFKTFYCSTLFAVALILISFGTQAQAQDVVSPPANSTGQKTQAVSIPITFTNDATNSPTTSYRFQVNYDSTVLRAIPRNTADPFAPEAPSTDKSGTLSVNCTIAQDTTTPGVLGIAAAGCSPPFGNASGTLLKVIFEVIGAPGSTSPLTIPGNDAQNPNRLRFEGEGNVIPTNGATGTFTVLAPTAASVNLSGKVLTADGRGLRGAQVILTTEDGNSRMVLTSAMGTYRFTDVQAGQTVTIRVNSKKYDYQTQTVNVTGERNDLNFVGQQ